MRNLSCLLAISLIVLLGALSAATGGPLDRNQALSEATRFFQEASQNPDQDASAELYRKALLRFEKLVQDGVVNGKLYYNLGNTYFRLHDMGRAIVNYRRALNFMPNDDNLRQNLRFVESRQLDRIEPKQETMIVKTLLFWHYDISAWFRLILLAAANAAFWGLLAVAVYRRRMFMLPTTVAFALTVMMAGSLLYDHFRPQASGVIVVEEAVARKGDGSGYSPSFNEPLHAGLTFSLVEKRGEWLYIELGDGRRCWVPSDSAEII